MKRRTFLMRVAGGAGAAGARSMIRAGALAAGLWLPWVPSLGGTLPTRPENPESLSFSTPIAITMSNAPEATA